MNANAETNVKLIARLTQEREVCFWGSKHQVTPLLLTQSFGDGRQVVKIQPGNTRPDYYLVRVDSSVDLDSEAWHDELDSLQNAIDDEFGTGCDDDGWPNPSWSSGFTWGSIALLTPDSA